MKAISPIVATVLLIAIVVVAFGILNAWVFNFTKTSTGDLKTEGTRQTVCANSDVSFNVLKYCNNSLSGIIFNSGMIPLGNFTIYVIYQNGTQQLFELIILLEADFLWKLVPFPS
jgi:flagellin-like protein